jgi:hypothetical protein
MIKTYKLDPPSTLFIDDSLANIEMEYGGPQ